MVEDVAYLALLALHMCIARTFATKHSYHHLVQQVLGCMSWREFFLVVLIKQIICSLLHYAEFKDSCAVRSNISREHAILLQCNSLLFACKQVYSLYCCFRNIQEIESMLRNHNLKIHPVGREVCYHHQHLVGCLTQEGIVNTRIEMLRSGVHIHKVEEFAIVYSLLPISDAQYLLILHSQRLSIFGDMATVEITIAQSVERPIVEYRCASIPTRETFGIHALFAKLLSGIEHKRITHKQSTYHNSRNSLLGIATEEVGSYTLLIVVLKEIEHVLSNVANSLPLICNSRSWTTTADYIAYAIIHSHLVVEIVETRIYEGVILVAVINFAYEVDLWVAILNDGSGITPK